VAVWVVCVVELARILVLDKRVQFAIIALDYTHTQERQLMNVYAVIRELPRTTSSQIIRQFNNFHEAQCFADVLEAKYSLFHYRFVVVPMLFS